MASPDASASRFVRRLDGIERERLPKNFRDPRARARRLSGLELRRLGDAASASARSLLPARHTRRPNARHIRARLRHGRGGFDLLRRPLGRDPRRLGREDARRLHLRAQAAARDNARARAPRRAPVEGPWVTRERIWRAASPLLDSTDFAYLRWMGARDITRFDEVARPRDANLQKWAAAIERLRERGASIFAYFSNFYEGHAP